MARQSGVAVVNLRFLSDDFLYYYCTIEPSGFIMNKCMYKESRMVRYGKTSGKTTITEKALSAYKTVRLGLFMVKLLSYGCGFD